MSFSGEDPELSDLSDNVDENYGERKPKRKLPPNKDTSMKKIKYEDITDSPKNKAKKELYKQPTVEELNELKETQNLYNNNLFRLQIEELLKEVQIKNKHRKVFSNWYETFQAFLNDLPDKNFSQSDSKPKNKKKTDDFNSFMKNALKPVKSDQDITINLTKPESCEQFGLYTLNALPGPKLHANINLKIPRGCFHVKDYLNNRYFVKKYCYLAYIQYYLRQKNPNVAIELSFYNTNKLLPILQIKLSEKVTVRMFATPTENYFKPSRCSPEISNVKVDVFNSDLITDSPTIFYNTSMAYDVALTANTSFIKENLTDFPNIQEAIQLIYVWLVQRELNVGIGAFTEDLILFFVAYLRLKNRINKHMSSYQVIRNFWNFINESDLAQHPISLAEDSKADTLDLYKNNFDVVFLDRTGFYNVTAFLNADVYKKIRAESAAAFRLLDDGGINSFHSLFITKLPVMLQYDLILHVESDCSFGNIFEVVSDVDRTKYVGFRELLALKYITGMLKKGLNNRAELIVPLVGQNSNKISFGISLNLSRAFDVLEKGPALNDPKEREFKEFWGQLATDRRFKDGSICVAVYFKTETVKQRREIIKTIIDWIITQKLKLQYSLHYNEFDDFLVNKKLLASYPTGSNEEGCLKAIAASDDLGKKLRSLEIPLTITGVQGISDTYSMTEVFPPISTTFKAGNKMTLEHENNILINPKKVGMVPRYVKPVECVLQLEHSSKWPKDLTVLRRMKTAFFIEISKLLAKKHNLVSSVKPDSIDILHEGFVFRYHLYLSREVGLFKKESTNNGTVCYKDTPQSRQIELRFNILPKIVGALKGLQSQFPSFGPATALIKRWLRSQLIDSYLFPDDVINLLNASLYLNQSAFSTATTPQVAFLRFLKFFSELQWDIQWILVNFNDELTKEAVAEIDTKLLQNREAYPVLFIATPYDNCESLFTKAAPCKEVLHRVKQLASVALNHVLNIFKDESHLSIKSLFVPSLDGYNVVINLRPLLNPVRHEQILNDESEKHIDLAAFDAEKSTKIPVTGFNPVQLYLKELRENYGEFALFFHDTYGGNAIGVLWIPKAIENRDFKVSAVNGRKLVDESLVLNVDALVEDFFILGKGIVKSIDKR